jgi:hypothetical protein
MSMRWTKEEALIYGFKQKANGEWYLPGISHSGQVPKPKSSVCQKPEKPITPQKTRKIKSEKGYKFDVRIVSYRKRHLDPDNLCPKWYIDEIVRAGLIPDDSSRYIRFVIKQVVVGKGEERTVIKIFRHEVSEQLKI